VAIQRIKLYQDIRNPAKRQVTVLRPTGQQDVFDVNEQQFSQLAGAGFQPERTSGTVFQPTTGGQRGSQIDLASLQREATDLGEFSRYAQPGANLDAAGSAVQDILNTNRLFSNVNLAALPTSGRDVVSEPIAPTPFEAQFQAMKAQGQQPTQILANYAAQQQAANPQNYQVPQQPAVQQQMQPKREQPPLPILPGQREALINKYLQAGYPLAQASARVDELFAGRPLGDQTTPKPATIPFAPTGEQLSTTIGQFAPQTPQLPSGPAEIPTTQLSSLSPEDEFSKLLQPTSEEGLTQQQLDDIIARQASLSASENLGLVDIQNQPIPLEFIVGQQAHLQRQAAAQMGALSAQEVPLKDKLVRLQQQRQTALDVSKYKAERAEAQAAAQRDEAKLAEERRQFDLSLAQKASGAGTEQPTSVREYNFYADQERAAGRTPLTFNEYQNMDANRKALITSGAGLSSIDQSSYLRITDKYQADNVVKQGDQAISLTTIADQVIANPSSATSQLTSLYLLVKNLDPESAVREGELQLANQTQSYFQQFGNVLSKIGEGRVISPKAAAELAEATKRIAAVWQTAATRRTNLYRSQASGAGIGGEFENYLGRYEETLSPSDGDPLDAALQGAGFSGDLGKSVNGLSPLARSIVEQESGGNYAAVGQPTAHGRALGRYQIVPKFHFAKIGLRDTPADHQKFLKSPQLQDKLFSLIIDDLGNRYGGDPRKIAAAYYGGGGAVAKLGTPAANVKQTAGGRPFPSINEYVNSVVNRAQRYS